jgi:hypothetical protein
LFLLDLYSSFKSFIVKFILALVVIFLLLSFCCETATATAGFAEWQIPTPGGNMISHIDPFIDNFGTCIREADKNPSVVYDNPKSIYVDHLLRWKYGKGIIMGEDKRGFFLFDEKSHAKKYFKSEAEFNKTAALLKINCRWFTGQDGWNYNWRLALQQRRKTSPLSNDAYWKLMLDQCRKSQEEMPYWAKYSEREKKQTIQILQQQIESQRKLLEESNDLKKYVPKGYF